MAAGRRLQRREDPTSSRSRILARRPPSASSQLPVLLGLSTHYPRSVRLAGGNISTDRNKSRRGVSRTWNTSSCRPSRCMAGSATNSTKIDHAECSHDDDGNLRRGVQFSCRSPGDCRSSHLNRGRLASRSCRPRCPGVVVGKLDEDNTSVAGWGADWHPIERTLIYASVSKGFKSGNFPTPGVVGLRSAAAGDRGGRCWPMRSARRPASTTDRLEIDGAVFYYDYRDKQAVERRARSAGDLRGPASAGERPLSRRRRAPNSRSNTGPPRR